MVSAAAASPVARLHLLIAVALAGLVGLGYIIATEQVWDEWFITFRYSRNLVSGQGLVYASAADAADIGGATASERRVQGYTSPLGVLIAAVGDSASSGPSHHAGLWTTRLVSVTALAAAAMCLAGLLRQRTLTDAWAPLVACVLMVADAKTIAFSGNGQPVALLVLGVLLMLTGLAGVGRWSLHAVAAGIALLAYADTNGLIWIATVAAAAIARPMLDRAATLRVVVPAAIIGLAIYLPWLIGSWVYYGQPIPHAITAAAGAHVLVDQVALLAPIRQAAAVFAPAFAYMGGWPAWVPVCSVVLSLLAIALAFAPSADRLARTASLAFVLGLAALTLIELRNGMVQPGSYPPVAVLGLVALAAGLPGIIDRLPLRLRPALWLRTLQAAAIICLLAMSAMSWVQAAVVQREIADKVRRNVGLWLKENVQPGQIVLVETAGAIAHYSDAHVLDWPGTVSPRIVALRGGNKRRFLDVAAELQPHWLILRTPQINVAELIPAIRQNYTPRHIASAMSELNLYDRLPGSGYVAGHATYLVFERTPGAAPPMPLPQTP